MGSGIFREAPVNKFGFVGVHDGGGHVGFVQLLKSEVDFAAGLNGSEQKAVNIRGGGFSVHLFRRQRVSHGSGGADDPSGEHAAVFAPVPSVENAVHVVMRMAGEDVHAAAAINPDGELIHGVIFRNAVGQGFVHGYHDGVNLRVGDVQLQYLFEPGH